jgi:hypothetical protein
VIRAFDEIAECPHFAVPDVTRAPDCACVFWAEHWQLEYENAARQLAARATRGEDPYTDDLF